MIRLHMELQTCLVNECLVTLLTAVPGSMEGLFMPIQRIFFCKFLVILITCKVFRIMDIVTNNLEVTENIVSLETMDVGEKFLCEINCVIHLQI